jgi:hypothetical protein
LSSGLPFISIAEMILISFFLPRRLLPLALLGGLAAAAAPPRGCLPPHHDGYPWCDTSAPAATRARALARDLTLRELEGMMENTAPAGEIFTSFLIFSHLFSSFLIFYI